MANERATARQYDVMLPTPPTADATDATDREPATADYDLMQRPFDISVSYQPTGKARPFGPVRMSQRIVGAISLGKRGLAALERLTRDICVEYGLGHILIESHTDGDGATWASVRAVRFPALRLRLVDDPQTRAADLAAALALEYDAQGERVFANAVLVNQTLRATGRLDVALVLLERPERPERLA